MNWNFTPSYSDSFLYCHIVYTQKISLWSTSCIEKLIFSLFWPRNSAHFLYPNSSLWSSRDQAIGFLLGHFILIPLAQISFFICRFNIVFRLLFLHQVRIPTFYVEALRILWVSLPSKIVRQKLEIMKSLLIGLYILQFMTYFIPLRFKISVWILCSRASSVILTSEAGP